MPSHKHREKRLRQSERRNVENTHVKTKIKSLTKKLAAETTPEGKQATMSAAASAIDKAAKSGAIHKRTAARKISRLAKKANKTA